MANTPLMAQMIADIKKRRAAKGQTKPATPAPSTTGGKPALSDWHDGKGKVHTKSLADHEAALRANDPTAVTAPLTPRQIDTEAQSAADAKYAPQQRAIEAQQRVS